MSLNEKQSLLPITNEECQKLECARLRQREKRNKKFRIITFAMCAFVLFLHVSSRPGYFWNHHNTKKNDDFSVSQTSSESIMTQGSCSIYPEIPFNGASNFESPEGFNKLQIKSESTRKYNRLSIVDGTTTTVVDPSVSKVTTNFHIKINSDEIQDKLWIEELKDEANSLYTLVVRLDDFTGDACITLDVVIRLPTNDALDSLIVGLPVTDIGFDNGLILNYISLSVAKGEIVFGEDQTFGNVHLSIASGSISGSLKQLYGDITASSANGNIDIDVKEVDTTDGKKNFKISTANGSLRLGLPTTFDSSFKLSNVIGSRTIEATNPDNIHKQHGSFGNSAGIYGDSDNLKGDVVLSTAKGDLTLSYTQ